MLDRCPDCDYPLTGLPANHRCPECGLRYDEYSRVWCRHAGWQDLVRFVVVPAMFLIPLWELTEFLMTGRPFAKEEVFFVVMVALFSFYSAASWPKMRSFMHRGTQVVALPGGLQVEGFLGFFETEPTTRSIRWEDIDLGRSQRLSSTVTIELRNRRPPLRLHEVFADEREAAQFLESVEFHVARRNSELESPNLTGYPATSTVARRPPPGVRDRPRLSEDAAEP